MYTTMQGTVIFIVGGDTYSLDLSSPTSCNVSNGDTFDGKADLIVTCSEEVMGKMIRKEVQPQQAFMKGMLKIKGKMSLAMKLTAVLAATRKKLPTSKLQQDCEYDRGARGSYVGCKQNQQRSILYFESATLYYTIASPQQCKNS